MIRRLVTVSVVGALLAVAAVLPRPGDPLASLGPPPTVAPVATPPALVAFCPWAQSDAVVDTALAAGSLAGGVVTWSFPVGGAPGEATDVGVAGPGAAFTLVGLVQATGPAPATAEFTSTPGAASALASGESIVAGDACPTSVPKVWHLAGGSTRAGEQLTLRLFNPFPDDARVSLTVVSNIASEVLPELTGLTVPSRGWQELEFHELLPFRDRLSIVVSVENGVVIPAMIATAENGERAMWAGTSISRQWDFPAAQVGNATPYLAIANPGISDVPFEIDVISATSTEPSAVADVISGQDVIWVPLADAVDGPFAIRLRSEEPVAAVLLNEGVGVRAATTGVLNPATRWLLPGYGVQEGAVDRAWIYNPAAAPLTVSYRPLGPDGELGEWLKAVVPPGAVTEVRAEQDGIAGLLLEALQPFSVAWSSETPSGPAALLVGVPVDG